MRHATRSRSHGFTEAPARLRSVDREDLPNASRSAVSNRAQIEARLLVVISLGSRRGCAVAQRRTQRTIPNDRTGRPQPKQERCTHESLLGGNEEPLGLRSLSDERELSAERTREPGAGLHWPR